MLQALQRRGTPDAATEKQLVTLLAIPVDTYDTVTVLGLNNFTQVLALLSPATRKVSIGSVLRYTIYCASLMF